MAKSPGTTDTPGPRASGRFLELGACLFLNDTKAENIELSPLGVSLAHPRRRGEPSIAQARSQGISLPIVRAPSFVESERVLPWSRSCGWHCYSAAAPR